MVLILPNFIRTEHEGRWEKQQGKSRGKSSCILWIYKLFPSASSLHIDIGNPSVNRSPSLFCALIGELTSIDNKSQLREVCQLIRE